MKRAFLLLVIIAAGTAFWWWQRDEPGASGLSSAAIPQAVQRGEYLARVGNCITCHTPRGGDAYAGGVAIATPFGTLYSSNITPDADTGLGRWTADDFWNALHHGKSKDGAYLYPAFPYPNYTRLTRDDSDAMYAFFRTIKGVRKQNQPQDLRFPYNRRGLMAVWRALYFDEGVHRDDSSRSAQWNRGAYLVQGLGHCSACHASRNVLGAASSDDYSGGLMPAQNWYAPALGSSRETSLGQWELEDLASFLRTGVSARAASYGPMSPVVRHGLQYLTEGDARAMAVYLKAQVRANESAPRASRFSDEQLRKVMADGSRVYETHCAECHQADGKGVPRMYPALAGNASILTDLAVNPIRMVYAGGFPPSTAGNPRPFGMPPFYQDLSDHDVAAVVSYIRRSWGNEAMPVTETEAARLRGVPEE